MSDNKSDDVLIDLKELFSNVDKKIFVLLVVIVLAVGGLMFCVGYYYGSFQAQAWYASALEAYRESCICIDKFVVR